MNFNQAEQKYYKPQETLPKIIGHCENCKEIVTDDYTVYTDFESNLFCSEKCREIFYGFKEWEGDE